MAITATALQITMAVVATLLRSSSFFRISAFLRCWARRMLSVSRVDTAGAVRTVGTVPVFRRSWLWRSRAVSEVGRTPVFAWTFFSAVVWGRCWDSLGIARVASSIRNL